MRRSLCLGLFAALLFGLAAAADAGEGGKVTLRLESPAFAPNGSIPSAYTCEGRDVSPPLAWSGVPEGTKSFALIVDDPDAPDPDAPKKTWVHWVLYNIPASTTSLPEGVNPLPANAAEGLNDWNAADFRGPCPPVGRHRYFFKLYALNEIFVPQHPLSKAELEKAMIGTILTQTTLIGTYEHSKK